MRAESFDTRLEWIGITNGDRGCGIISIKYSYPAGWSHDTMRFFDQSLWLWHVTQGGVQYDNIKGVGTKT